MHSLTLSISRSRHSSSRARLPRVLQVLARFLEQGEFGRHSLLYFEEQPAIQDVSREITKALLYIGCTPMGASRLAFSKRARLSFIETKKSPFLWREKATSVNAFASKFT